MMHRYITYIAFSWLTLSGTLHFAIDVVSQFVRGKRLPSQETTLYYGLHSSYALGQLLIGIFGLLVARSALDLVGRWPAILLLGVATAAWLAIGFAFIEYREPKLMIGVFGALLFAMAVTR